MRWGQGEKLWKKWDTAIENGRTPLDFIGDLSDESLIQLLTTAEEHRRLHKDLIATHLWNRLRASRVTLTRVVEGVESVADTLETRVKAAAPAVHENEQFTKRLMDTHRSDPAYEPEQAVRMAHDASQSIERVLGVMGEAQQAVEALRAFRDFRVHQSRHPDHYEPEFIE